MYVCCAVKMEDVLAARVLKLAYDALGQWLGAHLLDLLHSPLFSTHNLLSTTIRTSRRAWVLGARDLSLLTHSYVPDELRGRRFASDDW
jgi:hypothetical protein